MGTTQATNKAALKTRFQADTDLGASTTKPIQISRGSALPTTRIEGEYIEIGNAVDIDELHAGLGADSKQENYVIEIIISIVRSSRIPYDTVEDRAYVLYNHLWDSIIDWRSEATPFNGIDGWMKIARKSSSEFFSSDMKERECRITIDLQVTARI